MFGKVHKKTENLSLLIKIPSCGQEKPMAFPLTLTTILQRSRRFFPKKEIVTREKDGMHRYTYGDFYPRVARLAGALKKLGVGSGDRVATFAWNHHRHLEAYFAVPCMGAILHTLNIRLFPEQISYVVRHAEDKIILVDPDLLKILEPLASQLKGVKAFVVLGPPPADSPLSPLYSYEELLAEAAAEFEWPALEENSIAGLCYTTATTGNPKGVPYTHRGIVLQAFATVAPDQLNLSEADVLLPVVPMFHANAWGLPVACTWMGCKQVFPGAHPLAQDIADLIQNERVTIAAGVPTVWMGVLQELAKTPRDLSSLTTVLCGGSAAPLAMIETFEKKYGVGFLHAYGMTETYPLASVCRPKGHMKDWPVEEILRVKAKQGILVHGLEMKIIGDDGKEKAWDGKSMGELYLRGPWVTDQYYRDPEQTKEKIRHGWLCTGDVVTVDPDGYIQVQDRKKDLIKSGGEWISSIDLENSLMAHPKVAEAAVIGIPHPKWGERPLACVVPKAGHTVSPGEILEFLQDKVVKWWVPDEIVFLETLPRTSVGKFNKLALRERFKDKSF